jgi:hypothetical protein
MQDPTDQLKPKYRRIVMVYWVGLIVAALAVNGFETSINNPVSVLLLSVACAGPFVLILCVMNNDDLRGELLIPEASFHAPSVGCILVVLGFMASLSLLAFFSSIGQNG